MKWRKFFKPNLLKSLLGLFFSLIYTFYVSHKFYRLLPASDYHLYIMFHFIVFITSAILFYPSACSIIFLCSRREDKVRNKKELISAALILTFLNPFSFIIYSFVVSLVATPTINLPYVYPCGAKVLGYHEMVDNPALKAGIRINETIYIVADKEFEYLQEIQKILKNYHTGQTIVVKTREQNTYSLMLGAKPDSEKEGFMGLELIQGFCDENGQPI